MQRLALVLSAIAVGLVVSSCAVGVRNPATSITATSATLKGKVLSTTGGPGSFFIEYSPVPEPGFPLTERTPTRNIDFVANQSSPVSEAVDGLFPGRAHYFKVCAEDSENPGDPFCSPFQRFRTVGDSVVGRVVTNTCFELEATFEFDVASGPSGEGPLSGFAFYESCSGTRIFGTPLSLAVTGNRAVLGLQLDDGSYKEEIINAGQDVVVTDDPAPSS